MYCMYDMYVCMYLCMKSVCVYLHIQYVDIQYAAAALVCMYVCMCVCLYVCSVSMYLCMYVVCMHVCLYISMYVCTNICMYS